MPSGMSIETSTSPLPQSEYPDELELVERVQAGDIKAFGPLVDRHLPAIRAFIALKAPYSHLVDELAHEAFVWAFRHIGEFKAGTSLRAWLRAIANNLLRAEFQRMGREQKNLSRYHEARLVELQKQAQHLGQADEADALQGCWQNLPDTMRRLLEMKYGEGASTADMAGTFERSMEWVRITLFRVRGQLRECVERKLGRDVSC